MTFNRSVRILQQSQWEKIRSLWYGTNTTSKQRRANMLRVLATKDMPVNGRHYIQVHQDADLQRLIKQGKVKIVRRPYGGILAAPTTTQQWAVLVK